MALAPAAALCAPTARAATVTFNFTGAQQTFKVPAGVTSLNVVAVGGRGGDGSASAGGMGAVMTADVPVTPGEVLYIVVGANGATSGFNGGGAGGIGTSATGGAGGGASDVRRVSAAEPGTLASRVVVAAGGGGAGGGAGGSGGAAGNAGATCADCGGPGGAGTETRGGAGGSLAGAAGELRDGGAGGSSAVILSSGGGGGGGGLYGGGGGGARAFSLGRGGGGGGGGSSFAVGGEAAAVDATGVPRVTLSFTPPPPPTTPRPAYPLPGTIIERPSTPAGESAAPLRLMTPFPVVRIAGRVTRRGALVRLLSVRAPVRATIRVRCRGRGCPRRQAKRGRGINRPVRFRRFERSLRAGTLIEVRVSRAGLIGKFTRFRIRRGRPPARRDLCLRPGATRGSRCPDGSSAGRVAALASSPREVDGL